MSVTTQDATKPRSTEPKVCAASPAGRACVAGFAWLVAAVGGVVANFFGVYAMKSTSYPPPPARFLGTILVVS